MVDVLSVILVGLHFNLVTMLSFNKDISEVGNTHVTNKRSCHVELWSPGEAESKIELLGVYA